MSGRKVMRDWLWALMHVRSLRRQTQNRLSGRVATASTVGMHAHARGHLDGIGGKKDKRKTRTHTSTHVRANQCSNCVRQ